jgi:hypothetical protein
MHRLITQVAHHVCRKVRAKSQPSGDLAGNASANKMLLKK